MAIKVSGTTVINDSRGLENITDIPNIVRPLSITSPTEGSTDTGTGQLFTVDVSQFQAVFGVSSALQVQIDNNSDFSSPYYDVENVTSGSSVIIDTVVNPLLTNTLSYIRARYKDADGVYSVWTPTISYTSRVSFDYVNTPAITAPSEGSEVEVTGYSFISSALSTSGGSYTHISSDWQLSTNSSFTNIVAQTIDSTSEKTSWSPSLTLSYSGTYYVRVRHNASVLGDSEWSNTRMVTTGLAPGEEVYTTPGNYTWVPSADVTCSAVAVGGGGGGNQGTVHDNCGAAGGACSWINGFSATGGQGYVVIVGSGGGQGQDGGASTFKDTLTCKAGGGRTAPGGNQAGSEPLYTTDRTGQGGGDGGGLNNGSRSGAGGAGGYSGQGGVGQETDTVPTQYPATGGGGGAGYNINNFGGSAGGGVGIFGEGASGQNGNTSIGISGKGGSDGQTGYPAGVTTRHNQQPDGGAYGGGGGSAGTAGYGTTPGQGGVGGGGAVRIMWGGGRTFPNNADAV